MAIKKIDTLIKHFTQTLLEQCKDLKEAEAESWWLLEFVTNKSRSELISLGEIELTEEQEEQLDTYVTQRVEVSKPLQYIIGYVPFCGLNISVEPPILIPRPETEEWCSWLIEKLEVAKDQKLKILDIGAGSGCIALALAKALPNAAVIGVDINKQAIELCEKNKNKNNIGNATFIQSDLYENLENYKHAFDLIVSNPPYVTEEEFATLSKEVTEWEDKQALVANDAGFAIHKAILREARDYLNEQSLLKTHSLPRLLIEFGKGQEKQIKALFEEERYTDVQVHKDMEDCERWITGSI